VCLGFVSIVAFIFVFAPYARQSGQLYRAVNN
jgi:hypothetical protein